MRRLLPFLLLSFFSVAFAQQDVLSALVNVDQWFTDITTYVETYKAGFDRLAYALAGVGFAASLVSVVWRGSLGGMSAAVVRLMFVSGLIAMSPAIASLSTGTWKSLRDWSGGEMMDSFAGAAEEMEQLGNDAGILAMAATGMASKVIAATGKEAAYAAAQARAGSAAQMLNIMVIPVGSIAVIAHFIILGAGIIIVAACAFLPVAAGMLAFSPEQGSSWMGRVVSVIVSGLLLTAFMPLIFKSTFELAVVQPIAAVNDEFAEFSDFYQTDGPLTPPPRLAEIETTKANLLEEKAELAGQLERWNVFANAGPAARMSAIDVRLGALELEATALRGQWMAEQLGTLNNAYDAIANEITRWFTRLLVMLLATALAVGLTWWGAQTVAGLAGGVVASRVGGFAVSGGGLLARGGFRGAASGGKALAGGASGGSGSGYSVASVKPSYGGGPSGGGAVSHTPPSGASSTPSPAGGAATASLPGMRGASNATSSSSAGASSSTQSSAGDGVHVSTSDWLHKSGEASRT